MNKYSKYTKEQLKKFRKNFEHWKDEQEKEWGWERMDMNDDDLVGLACQIAADYYGGKE